MSKRQILMLLGLWVGVFLFLGFPQTWDKAIAVISAILIIVFSISLGSFESANQRKGESEAVPFVDTKYESRSSSMDSIRPSTEADVNAINNDSNKV